MGYVYKWPTDGLAGLQALVLPTEHLENEGKEHLVKEEGAKVMENEEHIKKKARKQQCSHV